MRTVIITAVLNGWIVEVGCQKVVYDRSDHLLEDLGNYMDDPKGFAESFIGDAINGYLLKTGPCTETSLGPMDSEMVDKRAVDYKKIVMDQCFLITPSL